MFSASCHSHIRPYIPVGKSIRRSSPCCHVFHSGVDVFLKRLHTQNDDERESAVNDAYTFHRTMALRRLIMCCPSSRQPQRLSAVSPVSAAFTAALFCDIATHVKTAMFRPAMGMFPCANIRHQRSASLRAGRDAHVHAHHEPFPRTVREAAVCEALCAGHHCPFCDTQTPIRVILGCGFSPRSCPCSHTETCAIRSIRCRSAGGGYMVSGRSKTSESRIDAIYTSYQTLWVPGTNCSTTYHVPTTAALLCLTTQDVYQIIRHDFFPKNDTISWPSYRQEKCSEKEALTQCMARYVEVLTPKIT